MNGQLVFTFSPKQLVEEILSNISDDDVISERQAYKLYGYAWVNNLETKSAIAFVKGNEMNSAKLFRRKDLERIRLESKYINQFKLIQL